MPTAYLNRRWISKFLVEKIVSEKSSLIHSILHKTRTITSGFEGKKRKYYFLKNRAILWYALSRAVHKNRTSQVRFSPSKPDLIRPKNTYLIVIGFLQAFIEPWEPNDRLHAPPTGYPSYPHLWPPAGNVHSCFLHWGQSRKETAQEKMERLKSLIWWIKNISEKSASLSKFCYKKMELPLE